MTDSNSGRAIVIGGSVGGLLAGLSLRQAGWIVDIYERVAGELSGRGAGIVVQPDLLARLEAVGLDPADLGVHVLTRKMFNSAGEVVDRCERAQVMTAWERVYRFLRDAFPREHYHRGKSLAEFAQTDQTVEARFTDGSRILADLLVGADGIRSGGASGLARSSRPECR